MLELIGKICFQSGMVDALDDAKRKAGGAAGLAAKLGGITPQAVSQWKRVPAERVLAVEKETGVSRHDLRPDIYGPQTESAA
jgi:DNA-binding transcriptional regulator YdaS (Cro superfamily)